MRTHLSVQWISRCGTPGAYALGPRTDTTVHATGFAGLSQGCGRLPVTKTQHPGTECNSPQARSIT